MSSLNTAWHKERPAAFWLFLIIFLISVALLVMGQTMALFDYELAVSLGMQEDVRDISAFGVAINKAFGAGDTLVYIPLIVFSIIGLILKRRWALFTSAAVMGISSYWTATAAFIFWFLEGTPGYSFHPGMEYWVVMTSYFVFGLWGLGYLGVRGEKLVR